MILPDCVKYRCSEIADYSDELSRSEASAISNACEKRRNEFSTGRHLLRGLLRDFGLDYVDMPKGANGGVTLPAGYCGSIAHTGGLCIAAMSPTGGIVSIGIDVELIGDVGEPECRVFMPDDEYEMTASLEPDVRRVRMAAAFSVREAIYKCLNPVFGRWIDFQDARVSFRDGAYLLEVKVKDYESLCGLECRYEIKDNMVFTSAVLRGAKSDVDCEGLCRIIN